MRSGHRNLNITEKQFFQIWKKQFRKSLIEKYNAKKMFLEILGETEYNKSFDEFCLETYRKFPNIMNTSLN